MKPPFFVTNVDTFEYVSHLVAEAGTVALVHQTGDNRWITGWFDSPAVLLRAALPLYDRGNLYTTVNASKSRVVSNRMTGRPIRDEDVEWIIRLPFDFDPIRPKGTSATDLEAEYAYRVAQRAMEFLSARGWGPPLFAFSGNGFHLQYRCQYPNTREVAEMLRAMYRGLKDYFSIPGFVAFDSTVCNPGRILPLYGTKKRKGQDTRDRPHRHSGVWIPPHPHWKQIPLKYIEALANTFEAQRSRVEAPLRRAKVGAVARGKGDYATLDIVAWMSAHGLYGGHIRNNMHAIRCPWEDEHSVVQPPMTGDTIVFESGPGWPTFKCQHNHCACRTIHDLIDLFGDADRYCARTWHGKDAQWPDSSIK